MQNTSSASTTASSGGHSPKLPRPVFEVDEAASASSEIYAFPPNRDTLGGTAYLILENLSDAPSPILVDCPAWTAENRQFLEQQGGVSWLFLTHRGAIGKVRDIQQAFGCRVIIQEQEAYLLPEVEVTTFRDAQRLSPLSEVVWTSGHSPGSACLYHQAHGGVLFSGRHLLPNAQAQPEPLRISKTFHWQRQLRNVQALRDRFTPETLRYICPGASTGLLRGKRSIDQAHEALSAIDLEALRLAKPGL